MPNSISSDFQIRRKLALAMDDLAQKEDGVGIVRAAHEICESFPDELVLQEIIRNLDTTDSRLRGGLGQMARFLPSEQVSSALRRIAADRSQSPQSRLTAVMLSSQYLGKPIPAALLADLRTGDEVAFQSLREAVDESKSNRFILLEYVLQMRKAGDHVPAQIMDLLERLPETDRVELLRLIALDDREPVALDAVNRLESLAGSTAGQDALRALYILQYMASPALVDAIQNALRRQRFRGNVYHPPEPVRCRALMTISDIVGNQAIWFVRMPDDEDQRARQHEDAAGETPPSRKEELGGEKEEEVGTNGSVLYVQMNPLAGLYDAVAQDGLDSMVLPDLIRIGETLSEDEVFGAPLPILEVPYDFARWRVLQALRQSREKRTGYPPDFRLYADSLFELAAPELPPNLHRYFASHKRRAEVASSEWLKADIPSSEELLARPAIANWLRQNLLPEVHLPEITVQSPETQRANMAIVLLAQMTEMAGGLGLASAMETGLRSQAAWFEISGETEAAAILLALAENTPHLPVEQQPIFLAFVETLLRAV